MISTKQMVRFIGGVCLALLLSPSVLASDLFVAMNNFTSAASATNIDVVVQPQQLWGGNAGSISQNAKVLFNSGSTASFWVSNVVDGIYQFDTRGVTPATRFYIIVTNQPAVVYAYTNRVVFQVPTIPASDYAWSTWASDNRYATVANLSGFVTNANTSQSSTNQILKSPAIDSANITSSTIIAPVLPSGLSLIGSFTWGPGEPLTSAAGPILTTNAGQVMATFNLGAGTNLQASNIVGVVSSGNLPSGMLTNKDTRTVEFDGGAVIKNTFGTGNDIYVGVNAPGNIGPFMNDHLFRLRFANDANGAVWLSYDAVTSLMTWGWNIDNAGYPETNVMRLYPHNTVWEQATAQAIAPNPLSSYNAFIPFHGGSASAMTDLPTHGPETWRAMPVPTITFFMDVLHFLPDGLADATNYINGRVFTNTLFCMKTNGVIGNIRAAGVPPTYLIDGYWHQNTHRGTDGRLTNNPVLWPLGMPFYVNFAHTNSMLVRLTDYYDTHEPTPGNTEADANTSGTSLTTFWPTQNPIPNEWVPYSTPTSVYLDAKTFFGWGVDSWRIADSTSSDQASGYGNQMMRQWNWASQFPGGYIPASSAFTNGPICIEYLNGTSTHLLPQEGLDENIVGFDVQNFSTTNNINLLMQYERLIFETNRWAWGKGHLPEVTFIQSTATTNDLRSAIAFGAVMPMPLNLHMYYGTNMSHATVWSNTELTAVMGVPCDNGLGVVAATNVATASTVIARRLTNGVVAVAVAVETNAAQNVVVNWAAMGLATNQQYAIRDLSWQTNIGAFRGTYTHAAPGPFITLLLFMPDSTIYASNIVSGGAVPAAAVPDLSTTYERHVATLTNGVYTTNLVGGDILLPSSGFGTALMTLNNGYFTSKGSSAGLTFEDRASPGTTATLYFNSGLIRFFSGGADWMTLSASQFSVPTASIPTNIANFNMTNAWITALASRTTAPARRSTLEIDLGFVDAAAGTPVAQVQIEQGAVVKGTNTWICSMAGGLASTVTNHYSFRLQPSAVVIITDISRGSGSSVTIANSQLTQE